MWESMGIFYWVYIRILWPAAKSSKIIHVIQVSLQSGAQAWRLPTRDHQSREHTLLPERCSSAQRKLWKDSSRIDPGVSYETQTGWSPAGITLLWQSLTRFHCSKTQPDFTWFHCNSPCSRCCKMLQEDARGRSAKIMGGFFDVRWRSWHSLRLAMPSLQTSTVRCLGQLEVGTATGFLFVWCLDWAKVLSMYK